MAALEAATANRVDTTPASTRHSFATLASEVCTARLLCRASGTRSNRFPVRVSLSASRGGFDGITSRPARDHSRIVTLVRSSDQKHRLNEMQRVLGVLTKRVAALSFELETLRATPGVDAAQTESPPALVAEPEPTMVQPPRETVPRPAREETPVFATAAPQAPAAKGLEEALTSRWLVWLGALAIALSGTFLVRYAIDHGLLGPTARCALGLLLGVVLTLGGEWLRERPLERAIATVRANQVPPALTAAGLFTAFASIYAAYALYDLLPPLVAFAGLALVALIGVGLSLLARPSRRADGIVRRVRGAGDGRGEASFRLDAVRLSARRRGGVPCRRAIQKLVVVRACDVGRRLRMAVPVDAGHQLERERHATARALSPHQRLRLHRTRLEFAGAGRRAGLGQGDPKPYAAGLGGMGCVGGHCLRAVRRRGVDGIQHDGACVRMAHRGALSVRGPQACDLRQPARDRSRIGARRLPRRCRCRHRSYRCPHSTVRRWCQWSCISLRAPASPLRRCLPLLALPRCGARNVQACGRPSPPPCPSCCS